MPALAFTVPASGYYEFGPTPDAQSQWPEETRNFKLIADDAAKGNEAQQTGVRITVDDVKIWPADQEYAVVKTGSNVAVPELENLALTAGQVLRVEARGLTVTRPEFPWAQKISASGQMTFRRPLEPAAEETGQRVARKGEIHEGPFRPVFTRFRGRKAADLERTPHREGRRDRVARSEPDTVQRVPRGGTAVFLGGPCVSGVGRLLPLRLAGNRAAESV